MEALKNRRKLRNKETQLRVGNDAQVAAVTVKSIELCLPSGLIMELKNVYFVSSISRNIISISCQEMNDFSFVIKDNGCSIYKYELYYGSSFMMNGLYMLEINKLVFNNNKRLKTSHENMTFMWHCRLGHINEKRIKKFHEVGLLGNFNIETINACESCLCEKMTKATFSKKGERTNDLLALIHTDICGPTSTYIRNSDRYFITFTDDYSRYDYVDLMRHKSESFEKFKEFRTEVENQLNKSIKALRLDREGEYLSYEFTIYLKEYEIVLQLTPPGTPQWNGISERSNRTLLVDLEDEPTT
jgi:GAG-pre-integrase domain